MRTVRCSGRLGGVCKGVYLEGYMPRRVSAQGGRVFAWGCLPGGVHLPPVDRSLDTCLWKHYLPTTIVADGKNVLNFELVKDMFLTK